MEQAGERSPAYIHDDFEVKKETQL